MTRTDQSARLKDLLGIRYPIIQAPMAGVSTPALAAEIANAGGLGSIAMGANTLEQAREEWEKTRALTDGSLNLNVFAHEPPRRDEALEREWIAHLAPLFEELGAPLPGALSSPYRSILEDEGSDELLFEPLFELLLELQPRAVSFHFGLPRPDQLKALHERGIVTIASATSLEEAGRIEAAGVQICVAQGAEAGGHRGAFDPSAMDEFLPLSALLSRLKQTISIPLIAAGGIMHGERIRELLSEGAAGVQLGTAFLLTPEAATPETSRARLKSADARETRFIYSLSGRPARGLNNRITAVAERDGAPPIPPYPIAYDAAKRLQAAARTRGTAGFLAQWAGAGAPLLRELRARALFDRLLAEAGLATS